MNANKSGDRGSFQHVYMPRPMYGAKDSTCYSKELSTCRPPHVAIETAKRRPCRDIIRTTSRVLITAAHPPIA